ncbi:glycosyltransferase family 4 protein [Solibacillus sp. FSL H8-0538]|uniref:glycosyltransferase family 4 protein n=1 Tax=Solibacillus sp. FSL H8-0538 TaxID=2921400 RepID=UPI0030F80405
MYKFGICGHFGGGQEFLDGQTVKTKILTEELKQEFGSTEVKVVDTHGWKKNPINLFKECLFLIKNCENIIVLPAHNGVKVFVPFFVLLNKIFSRKLYYMVIGGWLPSIVDNNIKLRGHVGKFTVVYVETHSMLERLVEQGLNNIKILPNFKRLEIVNENELVYSIGEPYKLCTFSRVMEEKGIEDAIKTVIKINESLGKSAYSLDIYGPIDPGYVERFERLSEKFPEYIVYKGVVDYNKTSKVLKDYFALLFPTHFKTEGVPGTIIDAYSAGVPVIASQWDSVNEIISHELTGIIYDYRKNSELEYLLLQIFENPNKINNMKINCLKKAKQYSTETVIKEFLKYL